MKGLEINPLFCDRVRLAIMATLAASRHPVTFTTLVQSFDVTPGNLSAHLRKLEEAGFVKCTKEFIGRKPRTSYECTARGRAETKGYLRVVEKVLKDI